MDNIKVKVTHELHQYHPTETEKISAQNFVETKLSSIKDNVIKWKAEIDLKKTISDNYKIYVSCDDEALRQKMQSLLGNAVSSL